MTKSAKPSATDAASRAFSSRRANGRFERLRRFDGLRRRLLSGVFVASVGRSVETIAAII
ncbi:MAG: hypothetical protein IJN32_00910 [Thermoguttaceae bacterium]|nr:hypothetical protein [Thermoguttaceae bacterium]